MIKVPSKCCPRRARAVTVFNAGYRCLRGLLLPGARVEVRKCLHLVFTKLHHLGHAFGLPALSGLVILELLDQVRNWLTGENARIVEGLGTGIGMATVAAGGMNGLTLRGKCLIHILLERFIRQVAVIFRKHKLIIFRHVTEDRAMVLGFVVSKIFRSAWSFAFRINGKLVFQKEAAHTGDGRHLWIVGYTAVVVTARAAFHCIRRLRDRYIDPCDQQGAKSNFSSMLGNHLYGFSHDGNMFGRQTKARIEQVITVGADFLGLSGPVPVPLRVGFFFTGIDNATSR